MAMVPHCTYGVIVRPPHCYMRGQSEWGTMSSTSGMDVYPVLSCFSTAVKRSLDPIKGEQSQCACYPPLWHQCTARPPRLRNHLIYWWHWAAPLCSLLSLINALVPSPIALSPKLSAAHFTSYDYWVMSGWWVSVRLLGHGWSPLPCLVGRQHASLLCRS